MVRSMYSGVSGLRTHQTRMDTIGNNIANVNTYGFKSARTTFRDIYYQQLSAAGAPTAATGGTNPSSVGYGTQVGSVDLMMGRSTFSMTDQTMDMAIDGDGFFQVQDSAGNTYYTRAGMLNFDASGNLVDMQGNFVLGVNGDPRGRAPSNEKIRVSLPDVKPTAGKVSQTINGKEISISASKNSADSNMNFNFTTDSSLADGEMTATLSSTGIIIKMNPDNVYADWTAFSNAVNKAVKEANDNKEHPAGQFTIKGKEAFPTNPMKASDICSTDYGVKLGEVPWPSGKDYFGGMSPTKVGSEFSASGAVTAFTCALVGTKYEVNVTIGGKIYKGEIDAGKTSAGEFVLKNTAAGAADNDTITMSRPAFADIKPLAGPAAGDFTGLTATPSQASIALGLSGTAFALRGGTPGGQQTIADMTGISISPNGIITGWDSQGKEISIGRIDIGTFANPAGLDQAGSSNYGETANSGAVKWMQPGSNGAGKLVGGTLELSNVDLSREFSDMITTQRGYQANSRIITVSDTMLEELINLKR